VDSCRRFRSLVRVVPSPEVAVAIPQAGAGEPVSETERRGQSEGPRPIPPAHGREVAQARRQQPGPSAITGAEQAEEQQWEAERDHRR